MKKSINVLVQFFTCSCLLAQNIGIGTTSPEYKLDVNGRMRVKTGTIGNNSTSSGIWLEDYRTGINRAFVGMQDSIRFGVYGSGANGIGWGFNFNAVSGDVSLPSGSIGLGTITPGYDIHFYRPNPGIGFYDSDNDDHFAGSIQGDSTDLHINAYRRASVFPSTEVAGNLIFQVNTTGPFVGSIAGKVGIGTASPDTKVHITNGTEVTETGGGFLQLGFSDNSNLAFDNTEIQARFDANVTKLYLQFEGGGVQIGSGDGTVNITSTGEVNRNNITGTANLLPLAFGRVSTSGTILGSTGNFTVQKGSEGQYYITLSDESNVYQNRNSYVILLTPYHSFPLTTQPYFANASIGEDNRIVVRTAKPRVHYTNSSCSGDCGPFSYISTFIAHEAEDNEFSILVYKY
jgi:hypothetical protein